VLAKHNPSLLTHSLTHSLAHSLTYYLQVLATYNACLGDGALELDRHGYNRALAQLGFAEPAKIFQGQLLCSRCAARPGPSHPIPSHPITSSHPVFLPSHPISGQLADAVFARADANGACAKRL
jgi:hypothetical protein